MIYCDSIDLLSKFLFEKNNGTWLVLRSRYRLRPLMIHEKERWISGIRKHLIMIYKSSVRERSLIANLCLPRASASGQSPCCAIYTRSFLTDDMKACCWHESCMRGTVRCTLQNEVRAASTPPPRPRGLASDKANGNLPPRPSLPTLNSSRVIDMNF